MVASLPSNIAQIIAADRYLGPLLANLLMCLCDAAATAPNPPGHCTFRIGTEVPHDLGTDTDLCCEGMAYVTMGNFFPSVNFPDEDIARQASSNCPPLSWGVNFTAALVRCAPVGGENGVVIPDRDWEAAALQGIYDTRTLQQAACCFRKWVTKESSLFMGMSAVIGPVVQGTPFGGCVERTVSFQIQTLDCGCP